MKLFFPSGLPQHQQHVVVPGPRILSLSETYQSEVEDTVELECLVENLGEMVLLWKRGARVLTAGEMMVRRDRRISLRGNNLVIAGVNKEDQGEYECEVRKKC